MRIVRTFECTPKEFFEAAADRFKRECVTHGSVDINGLDVGMGYEDAGSTTWLDVFEPTKRFGWSASSTGGRVVSLMNISTDEGGCRVEFDQEYLDQPAVAGKLGQALIFGQMSNMLIGIFEEVEHRREGVVEKPASASGSQQSLSLKLFKRIIGS